jgi:FtsP/CotA-like multicopper oxidase with cupredoxin domain
VFVENVNSAEQCAVGSVYKKARYIQYTDATFTRQVAQPESLGLQGPVIRGVVGDTIEVLLVNALSFDVSLHPHGMSYTKHHEGAATHDGKLATQDDAIAPGKSYRYVWHADADSGPAANDGSSLNWGYHSHVDSPLDTNTGLFGPLVITSAHCADPDTAKPLDVDREFFVA